MEISFENEELALILDTLDKRLGFLECEIKNLISPTSVSQAKNEIEGLTKLLDKIQKTIKWN